MVLTPNGWSFQKNWTIPKAPQGRMRMLTEDCDEASKPKSPSLLKALGWIAFGIITFFIAFIIFLIFSDRPYAIQIFTLLTYTAYIMLHVFLKSNLGPGYSFRNPAVQKKIPRLLTIHSAFSLAVFSVQTYVIGIWSRLPVSWTTGTGPKHDSWFQFGLIALLVITMMIETLICMRILRRSCDADRSSDSPIS